MNRPALLSRPAVRRLALAAPVAGLALAAAVIPAGMASARGGAPAPSTITTVSSSANPSIIGQPVTYTTTTVTSYADPYSQQWLGGRPLTVGAVYFLDNGTPITGCTAVPVSGGKATCQATPAPGTNTIVANYYVLGNNNQPTWQDSTATLTQQVNPPACNPIYCSGGNS
jgi:hypothetical protein